MKTLSLLIVTVNYRTADLTIECLASVAAQLGELPPTKLRVIDNDSGDGSVEIIAKAIKEKGWADWASVTAAGKNGGFSFGNNIAIREALGGENPPSLIWLLNPDAQLKSGAAKALVSFMDENPKTGLATSASVGAEDDEQPMAFRRFGVMSEFTGTIRLGILNRLFPNSVIPIFPQDKPFQADWLSGSSLMIRREVFDDIGLMDEDYFLYFEESDFCLQAQRKGWELWYVPESHIIHLVGAATGFKNEKQAFPRRPSYWFDSRRRYFLKNFGRAYLVMADVAHIVGFSVWRVRQFVQRKPDYDPAHYLKDFIANSVFLRGFSLENTYGKK